MNKRKKERKKERKKGRKEGSLALYDRMFIEFAMRLREFQRNIAHIYSGRTLLVNIARIH